MDDIKLCDRYCNGCLYSGRLANLRVCNYILAENKRRPCPAGTGCTVRRKAPKPRKPYQLKNPRPKMSEAERREKERLRSKARREKAKAERMMKSKEE